jgi:hypothetical protein
MIRFHWRVGDFRHRCPPREQRVAAHDGHYRVEPAQRVHRFGGDLLDVLGHQHIAAQRMRLAALIGDLLRHLACTVDVEVGDCDPRARRRHPERDAAAVADAAAADDQHPASVEKRLRPGHQRASAATSDTVWSSRFITTSTSRSALSPNDFAVFLNITMRSPRVCRCASRLATTW